MVTNSNNRFVLMALVVFYCYLLQNNAVFDMA